MHRANKQANGFIAFPDRHSDRQKYAGGQASNKQERKLSRQQEREESRQQEREESRQQEVGARKQQKDREGKQAGGRGGLLAAGGRRDGNKMEKQETAGGRGKQTARTGE